MRQLIGEYECKIDAKGRMRVPSQLLKQLGGQGPHTFVINRGMEKCLMLYPKSTWDKISRKINKLNLYIKKNREFKRYFFRGATELSTHSSGQQVTAISLKLNMSATVTNSGTNVVQQLQIWRISNLSNI